MMLGDLGVNSIVADRKLILLFRRKIKIAEKINCLFRPKNKRKRKRPPFSAEHENEK